jgi:hypothetical protein
MIFVVGNSRSGTTLLGRMLGNNSNVKLFPELHLFGPCIAHGKELEKISAKECSEIFMWLLDVLDNGFFAKRNPKLYEEKAQQMQAEFYNGNVDAWDAYEYFIKCNLKESLIPCEDMPGNVFKLDQILLKFPSCKIINIVRDPRDIILSQKRRYQRRMMGGHYISSMNLIRFWANYHPYFISHIWKNAVRSGIAYENHPNLINVRFEDLILNTIETLSKICTHCNITFEENMMLVPQFGSSTIIDDPTKFGVDNERIGTWNKGDLLNGEIEICEAIGKKEMMHFNYPLSNIKSSIFVKLCFYLLLPIKGVISFLFNWKSTKGVVDFIKTRIIN